MDEFENRQIEHKWLDFSPETPPLPWLVREARKDCWARVYFYEDGRVDIKSKRDRTEAFGRLEALRKQIFDRGTRLCIFVPVYDGAFDRPRNTRFLEDKGFNKSAITAIDPEEDEEYQIFTKEIFLNDQIMDSLVELIGSDQLEWALFLSQTGIILSVYNGGFDVIFPSQRQKDIFVESNRDIVNFDNEGY